MTEKKPAFELATCPECGASGAVTDRRCWLCSRPRGAGGAAAHRPATADRVLSATLALAVMVVVLTLIGVWKEAPGLAVGMAVIVVVPLVATAAASARARASGRPLGAGEKIANFLISLAVVIGLIVLLAVAAVLAFLIWCLSQ